MTFIVLLEANDDGSVDAVGVFLFRLYARFTACTLTNDELSQVMIDCGTCTASLRLAHKRVALSLLDRYKF